MRIFFTLVEYFYVVGSKGILNLSAAFSVARCVSIKLKWKNVGLKIKFVHTSL